MDILDILPDRVFPEPNTGCWLCVSLNNKHGYARLRRGERTIAAHRISYEMSHGAIPAGLEIDHLCRVSCCVNPHHLEAVTQGENKRRQAVALEVEKQFRCVNGHEKTPENIYVKPSGKTLQCRKCAAISRLRYKRKAA